MKRATAIAVLAVVGFSGCYHATIETGLTPSTIVLDKSWASGWIYGLVPPKTVETAARCPNGVARVETELSIANQLVAWITFGIYTPMSIRVTCAQRLMTDAEQSPTPSVFVRVPAESETIRSAFGNAADMAVQTRRPVLVAFE